MSALPWLKLFPKDWTEDKDLQACGLFARGLWNECMLYMHDCAPYGHLVRHGKALTVAALAKHVREPEVDVARALDELEAAGVFSRTDNGVIYSRRMVRDAAKRAARSEANAGNANRRWKAKEDADDAIEGDDACESDANAMQNGCESTCEGDAGPSRASARALNSEPLNLSGSASGERKTEGEGVPAERGRPPKRRAAAPWPDVLARAEFAAIASDAAFLAAWAEWIDHCSTTGSRAHVPQGGRATQMFRDAKRLGVPRYSAALRRAIANNWLGPPVDDDGPAAHGARASPANYVPKGEAAVVRALEFADRAQQARPDLYPDPPQRPSAIGA